MDWDEHINQFNDIIAQLAVCNLYISESQK